MSQFIYPYQSDMPLEEEVVEEDTGFGLTSIFDDGSEEVILSMHPYPLFCLLYYYYFKIFLIVLKSITLLFIRIRYR
jgi:hypothetical protein